MADSKSVGLFLLLPAPLNPIGAFDAEGIPACFGDSCGAAIRCRHCRDVDESTQDLKKQLLNVGYGIYPHRRHRDLQLQLF